MNQNTVESGKTIAIISYVTLVGTIIAYVMNNDKKNTFASFHIRQMIGLSIISLINSLVIVRSSLMASGIISLGLLVLWIIGLIGATKGEEKRIPLLGDQFQEWFKGI